MYEVWPVLEWFGLVKETKRIGRIALYTLNKENPIANKLDELSKEIVKYTQARNKLKKRILKKKNQSQHNTPNKQYM